MPTEKPAEAGTVSPASGSSIQDSRPSTLAGRVYEQLCARMAGGDFPPNSRLPPEHELAAMLGVSRPVLRTALSRLRDEGFIVSRQGAGSFVRDRTRSALAFSPVETIADIQRCYEFRLTIEPEAAFSAALRHNESALRRMEAALELLSDATNNQRHREDVDFSFHLAVTEAANNHYYSSTMQALKEHIFVGMHMHGLSLSGAKAKLQNVLAEHRAIYDAIRNGEPEKARDAMHKHLEGSRDRLFEGRTLDLSLDK
jgi:GntR family transcriptional regulator, transcriptional repressor for pyruvate dehydrogenase complex